MGLDMHVFRIREMSDEEEKALKNARGEEIEYSYVPVEIVSAEWEYPSTASIIPIIMEGESKPRDCYVWKSEEVAHWWADRELNDYICDTVLSSIVQNCGYYPLDEDQIDAINDYITDRDGDAKCLPVEDNLYYHIWY